MKIVKYIFLLLLLSGIAITVFIATQDGTYDIKKERIIKVPKTVLFNYVSDLKNWEPTGILTEADTTIVYTLSEATSGKDAFISWQDDETEGKIQTVKIVENDSILQNAEINNMHSDISWSFKDTLGSTKVTLRMAGKLSFTEKAYAVLNGGNNKKLEEKLERSLTNINAFLVDEVGTYTIDTPEQTTKSGAYYLGQSVKVPMADVGKKANEIFPKLYSFVKENNIALNGPAFIMYKDFSTKKDSVSFMVCLSIKEEIYTSPGSEFEGGNLAAFPALKTTLNGDYSHLPKAWQAAFKYVRDNQLPENTTGNYIEVYTIGAQQTKRPSQWKTDIFVPIGQPVDTTAVAPPVLPQPVRRTARPATAQQQPSPQAPTTTPVPERRAEDEE